MIAHVRPATWFGILGPVEAVVDGVAVTVAAPRQRALLASLVLQANQLVTVDELAEHLWGEYPPANARASIQIHMTRLRKLLGQSVLDGRPQLIETRANGYLLHLEPEQSDISQFLSARAAAARARSDRDLGAESAALSSALSAWRGEAFADVASESLHRDKVPYLLELKLEVIERRYEVELELAHHQRLIPELRADVARHPLRERLWYFLMLALSRCGQQAEALEVYRTVSAVLAQELNTAPSTELSALHQSIIAARPAEPRRTPAWTATCGLPADIPDFVGREDLLARITERLAAAASTSSIPVVSIDGPPGVGKTSLAVRAAHRLRKQFPDGQWYVRLSTSMRESKQPADVLAELLQAAGADITLLPSGVDARVAMLRARMADRRVLLVFDDALSAQAVRAALPGTAGSAVIVAGRTYLPDLVVHHSADPVHLGELSAAEARELLTSILGETRTRAESAAVDSLAEICARLPLALRVAAAYLMGRPLLGIDDFVVQLRRGSPRSALLLGAPDKSALVAALDCVYMSLSEDARRMLRLTGLLPGIDFSLDALGALTGGAPNVALGELTMSGLLHETTAGRFRANQLIQLYAADRVANTETHTERRLAIEQLLEWYLCLGDAAAERYNLTIAVSVAAQHGLHGLGRRIVMAVGPVLDPDDPGHQRISMPGETGAASDTAQIYALNARALYLQRIGNPAEGTALLREALNTARQRRDPAAEAFTLGNLTAVHEHVGHLPESLGHAMSAITLKRTLGSELDDPEDLCALATMLQYSGKSDQAIAQLRRAIRISRILGSRDAEARARCGLSAVFRRRRQSRYAVAQARKAGALAARTGDSGTMAMALHALGEALQVDAVLGGKSGQMPEAMEYQVHALDISDSIGDRLISTHANIGLSAVFRHLGDHDRALEHAVVAKGLTVTEDFRLLRGKALGVLAVANLNIRRFPVSSEQIDEAIQFHAVAGNAFEEDCHRSWQRIIRKSEMTLHRKVLL